MSYSITTKRISNSRIGEVDFDNIVFGHHYSDHMFIADYKDGKWQDCRIVPYDNINLSPASSFIHYGQSIFEGMKAYKDPDGMPQLFRPLKNHSRFNISAKRMAMPDVPEEIFMNGLNELIKLDQDWVPAKVNYSLYVRPFMFATDAFIGIKPTERFRFMIITSPAGAYYPKPVKVIVTDQYVRAYPGGTGYAKASGNYARAMMPLKEAKDKGYDQILWLDGKEFKYVQEIGTMNIFFIIGDTFVTPMIEDTILDGITRDSVIQLLKSKGVKVEERKVDIAEVVEANKNGTLKGCFGTGTAATIAPIETLNYKGQDLQVNVPGPDSVIMQLKEEMESIKTSRIDDPFNWVYKVPIEKPVQG